MQNSSEKICVIGLGYVGLPLAFHFAQKYKVLGFDISTQRINELKEGIDNTDTYSAIELRNSGIEYADKIENVNGCNVFIVTVPTPVDRANVPDLAALVGASETVGKLIKKGGMVVFESTVYPGATEEECLPVIEKLSGLKRNQDFKVGYSPERINPGDKEHTFANVVKVVAGLDKDASEWVYRLYSAVVPAGIHVASSIKVAEAAKVIENTQRDLNIALVNELALICDRLDIDTTEVLDAASTKWNFLNFRPGLVGGHCIGVDPYYLTYKAEMLGYHPQVIAAGRRINDSMAKYVANRTIKKMVQNGIDIKKEEILILGATFKENCPDLRNSKVFDVYFELKNFGANVVVHDPVSHKRELSDIYQTAGKTEISGKYKVVIFAVNHNEFREIDLTKLIQPGGIIIDLKNMVKRSHATELGYKIWKL